MNGLDREEIAHVLDFYRELGVESVYVEETEEGPGWELLGGIEKKRALDDLRGKGIGDCKRCRLSETRTNIVFGEGDPDGDLMFIGEGPGADEDKQGRPFVGRAGQVLTSLIEKMGFRRDDVYIANIVKCRPPDNRNPHTDEAGACLPFLRKQIEIISPKVIMLLGNVALQNLLSPDMRISRVRGKFQEYDGIKVMPTFHPSYLMRNPKDKWLTWEDAVAVLKYLGKDVVHDPGQR